jgi:thiamine-monophosphate kinase
VVGIQACGFVPEGQALQRAGARPGDRVFVTGELGDAGLALQQRLGRLRLPEEDIAAIRDRLDRPTARVAAGVALRGIASSAIDISDGLAADLGHILERSGVGARIERERVPVSAVYRRHLSTTGWDLALAHGDDYELCFTVPPLQLDRFEAIRKRLGCAATEIGAIVAGEGLDIIDPAGKRWAPQRPGHDHFG